MQNELKYCLDIYIYRPYLCIVLLCKFIPYIYLVIKSS